MSAGGKFTQEWFEMRKELRADIMRSAWVPLYLNVSEGGGEYGYEGYWDDSHYVRTLIVPVDKKAQALELEFSNITYEHAPHVEDGKYFSANEYEAWSGDVSGIHPVLIQHLPDEPPGWYLHHDIILGLGLKKEGNSWVCPAEDYKKVLEIKSSADGRLQGVLIRMEQLRDFLCARGCGLLIATYRDRAIVSADKPEFNWKEDNVEHEGDHSRWTGSITFITEGGHPFGSSTAVFWAGRKTPEPEDEVPMHGGPFDEDIESSSREIKHTGKKLYSVLGRLWMNRWVPPGDRSPRVGDDREESTIEFIADGSGRKAAGSQLEALNGWLWFKPTIVEDLLSRRHGLLEWYTKDTGRMGSSPTYSVHFGINPKGLINVYGKDIYLLPDFHKRIWQAHNVTPDGKPSQELWEAQMRARPASTHAPEMAFFSALAWLEKVSSGCLGSPLLRHHDFVPGLLKHIHRFRGNSMQGLCALAKDLDRIITERIDTKLLDRYAPPPDKSFRSIKRLAHFLDILGKDGRLITAPLAGINTLRQGDAHLPSPELHEALELIKIADTGNYLEMAQRIIEMMCATIVVVSDSIEKSSLAPKQSL